MSQLLMGLLGVLVVGSAVYAADSANDPPQATQRVETVTSVAAVVAAAGPMALAAEPAKQPMYAKPAGATRY